MVLPVHFLRPFFRTFVYLLLSFPAIKQVLVSPVPEAMAAGKQLVFSSWTLF
jgi:hypothetical protein